MDKTEARYEIEEQIENIYEAMNCIEEAIKQACGPDSLTLKRAQQYWMAHIDGALFNRKGWLGGSFINAQETLDELDEEEQLEEPYGPNDIGLEPPTEGGL